MIHRTRNMGSSPRRLPDLVAGHAAGRPIRGAARQSRSAAGRNDQDENAGGNVINDEDKSPRPAVLGEHNAQARQDVRSTQRVAVDASQELTTRDAAPRQALSSTPHITNVSSEATRTEPPPQTRGTDRICTATREVIKDESIHHYVLLKIPNIVRTPPNPSSRHPPSMAPPICTLRYEGSSLAPVKILMEAILLSWADRGRQAQSTLPDGSEARFMDGKGNPARAEISIFAEGDRVNVQLNFDSAVVAAAARTQWPQFDIVQHGKPSVCLDINITGFFVKLSPKCDVAPTLVNVKRQEYIDVIASFLREHAQLEPCGAWWTHTYYGSQRKIGKRLFHTEREAWIMLKCGGGGIPAVLPGFYSSKGSCSLGDRKNLYYQLDYPLRDEWCDKCLTLAHKRETECREYFCCYCKKQGHTSDTCKLAQGQTISFQRARSPTSGTSASFNHLNNQLYR